MAREHVAFTAHTAETIAIAKPCSNYEFDLLFQFGYDAFVAA